MTKPVLFSFMSGSGLSDLWPPPPFFLTIFVSFMCAFSHICNDCVVFGSICFVSCLHVLCMYWHSLSSFFCSCPAPVFRIYDPPCIFWPFLSCFTSSCVVSVRISVRLFCVPSTCIVSCIWLSFTLQSFFYLLSCPASVFLSWLCISSCLLLYKRHLFCWIGTKKQSSRHSVSTISSALFCSLSWHSFYSTYY
jgi:hypothetical protein